MILLLLAMQAAAPGATPPGASPLGASPPGANPLGAIGRQALPATGCAAYLWTTDEPRRLVAMAAPRDLRLAIDGKPLALARSAATGDAGLGLAASTEYRVGDVTATLDLTLATRADLTEGAVVSAAAIRLDRAGRDSIVVPVAGLVGCGTAR